MLQVATALAKEAKLSLRNMSGKLTFSEFLACYERLERWLAARAREGRILAQSSLPPVPAEWHDNATLRKAYTSFCRFGLSREQRTGAAPLSMTSQQWAKLCCDAGLLEPEGVLPSFAVDIIFATCKPAGQRRLAFEPFLQALSCVAKETGLPVSDIAAKMGCHQPDDAEEALHNVFSLDAQVLQPTNVRRQCLNDSLVC